MYRFAGLQRTKGLDFEKIGVPDSLKTALDLDVSPVLNPGAILAFLACKTQFYGHELRCAGPRNHEGIRSLVFCLVEDAPGSELLS